MYQFDKYCAINAWPELCFCGIEEFNTGLFKEKFNIDEVNKIFFDFLQHDIDKFYCYDKKLRTEDYNGNPFMVTNFIFTIKNNYPNDDPNYHWIYSLSVDFNGSYYDKWHIILRDHTVKYYKKKINPIHVDYAINYIKNTIESNVYDNDNNDNDDNDDDNDIKFDLYDDILDNCKSYCYKKTNIDINDEYMYEYMKYENKKIETIDELKNYLNKLPIENRIQTILTFLPHIVAKSGK
jgi:hypothetical protein